MLAGSPPSCCGAPGPSHLIPGCTGGSGSCTGHRHMAHSPGHWPASSGRERTGHIWDPPRWADTGSAHSPRHRACPAGTPRCCSHNLQEGRLSSGKYQEKNSAPENTHAGRRPARKKHWAGLSPVDNMADSQPLCLPSHLAAWRPAGPPLFWLTQSYLPTPACAATCWQLVAQHLVLGKKKSDLPAHPHYLPLSGISSEDRGPMQPTPHNTGQPPTHGGSLVGWCR